MKIMGVDPALGVTGVAVIEVHDRPGDESVLHTSLIKTSSADGRGDTSRLAEIADKCLLVAQLAGVMVVGIEKPYISMKQSPRTALRLSELHGVLRDRMAGAGYEVFSIAPASRCVALGVSGRLPRAAAKAAVMASVLSRYGMDLSEDEADAVGTAVAAWAAWRKAADPKGKQLGLGIKAPHRRKKASA